MEWIYWVPPVICFAFAVAWHTWTYGWNTRKWVFVAIAILAGLVVQRLVFAG